MGKLNKLNMGNSYKYDTGNLNKSTRATITLLFIFVPLCIRYKNVSLKI